MKRDGSPVLSTFNTTERPRNIVSAHRIASTPEDTQERSRSPTLVSSGVKRIRKRKVAYALSYP
jgi:hypothetical protein